MVFDSCWISRQLPILLLIMTELGKTVAVRPEIVLENALVKPFVPTGQASNDCLRDGAIYLDERKRYVPWALQMYDASAKLSPGIMTGNNQQLGNYDECLRIKSGHGFVGQACFATIQFDFTKRDGENYQADVGNLLLNANILSNTSEWPKSISASYEWMWCIPSSCTNVDLQKTLEIALSPLKQENRVNFTVQISSQACHTLKTDRRVFDIADWIYISIVIVFIVLIIASTTYNIIQRKKTNTLDPKDRRYTLLTSFSLYTNGKNLLKTKRPRNSIECLDGLRFISICWVIYVHTHYNEVVSLNTDFTSITEMHNNWSAMLVLNGNIVTDTFFLLSGTLLAYVMMSKNKQNSNKRLNFVNLLIHRYLRLTPAYAMIIGFYATLFYKLDSGPHWDKWVGTNRNYCRENWWTNLLYVNNFVNVDKMCMSQSWYLATDMQLLWLSLIFLYPMIKFSKSFFFWCTIVVSLILSILSPFLVTFFNNLTGTMLYSKEQLDVANVYLQIYTRVYNRAGPYIIGLGLGYILSKKQSSNLKISKTYLIIAWTVAIVAGLSVIFGPIRMYLYSYNRIEASFYAGFHRHVFALSVSWIIFASTFGYAGPIGKLLSWTGWMPLSKLSYCAYLTHFTFLLADAGHERTPKSLNRIKMVHAFFGYLVLTMLLSVIWSLCFEMPFVVLGRALISRKKRYITSKKGQGNTLNSIDMNKTIFQSTDPVKINRNSAYNSQGTIKFFVDSEEEYDLQNRKKSNGRPSNCIYVINTPFYYDDCIIESRINKDVRSFTLANCEYNNNTNLKTAGSSNIPVLKDLNKRSKMARDKSKRPTSTYGSIEPCKGTTTSLPEASFTDRSILIASCRTTQKFQDEDEENQARVAFQENLAYSNDMEVIETETLKPFTIASNDFNSSTKSNNTSEKNILYVSAYEPMDKVESICGSINQEFENKSKLNIEPCDHNGQQNINNNNTCAERKNSVIMASDHNFNRKY